MDDVAVTKMFTFKNIKNLDVGLCPILPTSRLDLSIETSMKLD